MPIRPTLALLAALLAAACGDSSGADLDTRGSLSFTFAGSREGGFEARGDARRPSDDEMAVALRSDDPAQPGVLVLALDAGTSAAEDDDALFMLGLPPATAAGDYAFGEACQGACASGTVLLPVPAGADSTQSGMFELVAGAVHVTQASSSRLSGTFSGTARDLLGEGEIAVTAGRFDVPLVPERSIALQARRRALVSTP